MAHPRMVDSYLRELLAATFGDAVDTERDGYILPLSGRPFVEVVPAAGNLLRVRVTAPVAIDVTAGPVLFERLNDVNAGLPYGRVFVADGQVLVEDTILGEALVSPQLDNAVRFVSWAVGAHGPDLAIAGGGRPALDAGVRPGDDPAGGTAPGRDGANVGAQLDDAAQLHLAGVTDDAATAGVGAVPVNAAGYL
jgi:hypothetical protein